MRLLMPNVTFAPATRLERIGLPSAVDDHPTIFPSAPMAFAMLSVPPGSVPRSNIPPFAHRTA